MHNKNVHFSLIFRDPVSKDVCDVTMRRCRGKKNLQHTPRLNECCRKCHNRWNNESQHCFKEKQQIHKYHKTDRNKEKILEWKRDLAQSCANICLTVQVEPWQLRLMRTTCPGPGMKGMPWISSSEPNAQLCQVANKQRREKKPTERKMTCKYRSVLTQERKVTCLLSSHISAGDSVLKNEIISAATI